jgi:hypothetical protein
VAERVDAMCDRNGTGSHNPVSGFLGHDISEAKWYAWKHRSMRGSNPRLHQAITRKTALQDPDGGENMMYMSARPNCPKCGLPTLNGELHHKLIKVPKKWWQIQKYIQHEFTWCCNPFCLAYVELDEHWKITPESVVDVPGMDPRPGTWGYQ